jgi:hypothetical protein
MTLRRHGTRLALEGTTISDALKLELLLAKDLQGPGSGDHTLISQVA